MTRPISRPMHGLLTDYPYVALVALAPETVGFGGTPARLCRLLSGGILGSSLLTRAEWGLFRTMPYRAHLAADAAVGAFALAAPWLLGFSADRSARTTFLVMGAFGLAAGLLSQPDEMPGSRGRR